MFSILHNRLYSKKNFYKLKKYFYNHLKICYTVENKRKEDFYGITYIFTRSTQPRCHKICKDPFRPYRNALHKGQRLERRDSCAYTKDRRKHKRLYDNGGQGNYGEG